MGTLAQTAKGLAGAAAVTVIAAACGPGGGRVHAPSASQKTTADVTADTSVGAPAASSTAHVEAPWRLGRPATLRAARSPAGRLAAVSEGPVAMRTTGPAHQQEATPVAGDIISAPALVPTAFDPSTGAFKGVCTEEWTGDWTGVSACNVTNAHFDRSTGEATATITDAFTGTYMGDHSKGTLTIAETFTGNLLTGSGLVEGQIVASGGDPTFRCSSGSVTIPVFLNPAIAYGGYTGAWRHGCGGMTSHV
jgi:hypothetical protein